MARVLLLDPKRQGFDSLLGHLFSFYTSNSEVMRGGTVIVGKVEPGSKILKPLGDPLCYVHVEAVLLLASMELVGKPVWIEILTAESEILGIVVWLILNCFLDPYLSLTIDSICCTVGFPAFPVKSNRTSSAVTLRPTSVSNLRNLLPIGTFTVLLCLSATVVLTFEVRYVPLTLGVKLVRDGPR